MSANNSRNTLAGYINRLSTITDNHAHAELRDRVVAMLGVADLQLASAVIQAGAKRCYAVGPNVPESSSSNIVSIRSDALTAALPPIDVAFFDPRGYEAFDYVNGVTTLVAQMKRILRPDGVMFCVLKSGEVNHNFDVYNSIVRTGTAFLPSQEYLFRDLLRDCTIRMLDWIPSSDSLEKVRFLRLSVKRPTLLLILGRSQSGKTSLARELQAFDPHMHISNDYVYCEVVDKVRRGAGSDVPSILVDHLGDGSGEACGAFNRAIESKPELLRAYLTWVVRLLPRDKRVISMDLDVVDNAAVESIKTVLVEAGFSVWIVRR